MNTRFDTPDIILYNGTIFTADGTAVEWGGSGASYLYSDAPLPINVPRLNQSAAKPEVQAR